MVNDRDARLGTSRKFSAIPSLLSVSLRNTTKRPREEFRLNLGLRLSGFETFNCCISAGNFDKVVIL